MDLLYLHVLLECFLILLCRLYFFAIVLWFWDLRLGLVVG